MRCSWILPVLLAAALCTADTQRRPARFQIDGLRYAGAFRLKNGQFGASSVDYAVGTLALCPARNSLFIAGHPDDAAIAEYALVTPGRQSDAADLPETAGPVQRFVSVLEKVANPDALDRITGLLCVNDSLVVNAEQWNDATGAIRDTTLVLKNVANLAGAATGLFQMDGATNAAGYMGWVPPEFQALFGGANYFSGWSSVYSTLSRYSQGPSLWTIDPTEFLNRPVRDDPVIAATASMNFDYNGGQEQWLSPRAVDLDWDQPFQTGPFPLPDPLWNPLSRAIYAFLVRDTRTLAVIGSTGGLSSGIGYRAVQSNGDVCPGQCPFEPSDKTNYYWLFDVDDIARAANVWDTKPYAHGEWRVPFDKNGEHRIIGAVADHERDVLYVALENAAQVGQFDRPPVIVTFDIKATFASPSPSPATPEQRSEPPTNSIQNRACRIKAEKVVRSVRKLIDYQCSALDDRAIYLCGELDVCVGRRINRTKCARALRPKLVQFALSNCVTSNPATELPPPSVTERPLEPTTVSTPLPPTQRPTSPPPPTQPPAIEPSPEVPSTGLADIGDIEYKGAFKLKNGVFGSSSIDYAVGTLAYCQARNSLFIAGHAQHNSVAEYRIVPSSNGTSVDDLPETGPPLQNFVAVLDSVQNPEGLDRITGMLCINDSLVINAEKWYDASGTTRDTTLVVERSRDLPGRTSGMYELEGGANAAGYMGDIPESMQRYFGGAQHFTGWSSVYSITSRYSQGPSLWTFSPSDLRQGGDPVSAKPYMNFDYEGGPSRWLSARATEWAEQGQSGPFRAADNLWNSLSKGVFAFFIPGSRTFAVIGSSAGLSAGIGYKAVQSNGNVCPGPCPYEPLDQYNYYWLFDAEEFVSAKTIWNPRPYAYGKWELPFDNRGQHRIIGGTVDLDGRVLYVALENAAQTGEYDRPPLILTYRI